MRGRSGRFGGLFGGGFECELARVRVVLEELAVTTPVDGDVELAARFLFTEAASERVEEEPLRQAAWQRSSLGRSHSDTWLGD